jgi:hypothetical protein
MQFPIGNMLGTSLRAPSWQPTCATSTSIAWPIGYSRMRVRPLQRDENMRHPARSRCSSAPGAQFRRAERGMHHPGADSTGRGSAVLAASYLGLASASAASRLPSASPC